MAEEQSGAGKPAQKVVQIYIGSFGSGKSTLRVLHENPRGQSEAFSSEAEVALPHFINVDLMARQYQREGMDERAAYDLARDRRETRADDYIAAGESFAIESAYGSRRQPEMLRRAKEAGYTIIGWHVSCGHIRNNIRRAKLRFERGRHRVMPEEILRNYPRCLANTAAYAPLFDALYFYESRQKPGREPFLEVARLEGGRLQLWHPRASYESPLREIITGIHEQHGMQIIAPTTDGGA